MHEVIQHVGIVLRLDMWRIAAEKKNSLHKTLDEFADSNPTLEQLQEMAQEIQRDWEKEEHVLKRRTGSC